MAIFFLIYAVDGAQNQPQFQFGDDDISDSQPGNPTNADKRPQNKKDWSSVTHLEKNGVRSIYG